MATIKRNTVAKAAKSLSFNLRAEAHTAAELLVAAADMRAVASAELGGATGFIRDSLCRAYDWAQANKQDFLLIAAEYLGNGERGKNGTRGLIREECASMKSDRAGDVACSQGRTIARWMASDHAAFLKSLKDDKGNVTRLKDLYDSAVSLGYGKGSRRKSGKVKTETQAETVEQWIARVGVKAVLVGVENVLKAAGDKLDAAAIGTIAKRQK